MRQLLFLTLISAALLGCGQQITNFVQGPGRGPATTPPRPEPKTVVLGDMPVRLSSGTSISSGTAVQGNFSLTPSDRSISGTHVSGTLSLHQQWVK